VQDGRVSSLELARFVPLDTLLNAQHQPAAQLARLSVIKRAQGADAMFALFKAAWLWCRREQLRSIVIATPPWSKHIYNFMCFEELGADGQFHHGFAGGAIHTSMVLPVPRAEAIWRRGLNPLCEQFFDMAHPALAFD
jgi:hypothetical protein